MCVRVSDSCDSWCDGIIGVVALVVQGVEMDESWLPIGLRVGFKLCLMLMARCRDNRVLNETPRMQNKF
jgi:hypothetical protein